MLSIIENRRSAVRSLKDREVAESKLATFRDQFEEGRKTFAGVIAADRDVLKSGLSSMLPIEKLAADNVSLQAQAVFGSYEVDDAGRHWRTRRGGNWGYMEYLQAKVANTIFPTVADQLNAKTAEFGKFIDKFRTHLKTLSDASDEIKRQLQIGDEFSLNMATELETLLEKTLAALQELIAGEEKKIVVLLENFAEIDPPTPRASLLVGHGYTWIVSLHGSLQLGGVNLLARAHSTRLRGRYVGSARHRSNTLASIVSLTLVWVPFSRTSGSGPMGR